jgi:hypothetical protein
MKTVSRRLKQGSRCGEAGPYSTLKRQENRDFRAIPRFQ